VPSAYGGVVGEHHDVVALNLKGKGDLAELMVAADLRRRGFGIAIPFGEDLDFDLVLVRASASNEYRSSTRNRTVPS
jgi:PD-(D/E)XK endonuclease